MIGRCSAWRGQEKGAGSLRRYSRDGTDGARPARRVRGTKGSMEMVANRSRKNIRGGWGGGFPGFEGVDLSCSFSFIRYLPFDPLSPVPASTSGPKHERNRLSSRGWSGCPQARGVGRANR